MNTCPAFTASSTGGELSLPNGRLTLLYFYPKDNTPGCTNQAIAFRDHYPALQAAGVTVIGVSRDSLKSHHNFQAKHELPFELISDPTETVCELFAVMKLKNMYGKQVRGIERSTFLIDGAGNILREWRGVKVPAHAEDVLSVVNSL